MFLLVMPKVSPTWGYIVTLVADIFNVLMFPLDMSFQLIFRDRSEAALITVKWSVP